MVSQKKVDMTKGPIMQLVILFALPICIGNVLQQLYNTVRYAGYGNFCNSVSLAAVGTSTQPVEIFLCLFLGIGSGVSFWFPSPQAEVILPISDGLPLLPQPFSISVPFR